MLKIINCIFVIFLSRNHIQGSHIGHYSNVQGRSHQNNEHRKWLGTGGYRELRDLERENHRELRNLERGNHPQLRTTDIMETLYSPTQTRLVTHL